MSEERERRIGAKLQLIYLLYFISLNYGKRFTIREIEERIKLPYTSIDNLITRAIQNKYLDSTNDSQKSFTLVKGGVIRYLKLSSRGLELVKTLINDLNTQRSVIMQLFLVSITLLITFIVFLSTGLNFAISLTTFIILIIVTTVILTHFSKRERLRLLKRLLNL